MEDDWEGCEEEVEDAVYYGRVEGEEEDDGFVDEEGEGTGEGCLKLAFQGQSIGIVICGRESDVLSSC